MKSQFPRYRQIANEKNVPMWVGEFGEDSYKNVASVADAINSDDVITGGWSFFQWKEVPKTISSPLLAKLLFTPYWLLTIKMSTFRPLATISTTSAWDSLIFWVNYPDRMKKPSSAEATTAMSDFVAAVQYRNNKLSRKMVQILTAP